MTATAARPHFSSSEGEDEFLTSGGDLASSDLDTDFSADENPQIEAAPVVVKPAIKTKQKVKSDPSPKPKLKLKTSIPSLKLKIKLPASPASSAEPPAKKAKKKAVKKGQKSQDKPSQTPTNMSKKMRESLALNRASSSSDSEDSEAGLRPLTMALPALPAANGGYVAAKPDDKLYCVCQSPHDAVSEMIGCDAPDCRIEWFHFECVGIMVPPEGQWYCPECTKRYNIRTTY